MTSPSARLLTETNEPPVFTAGTNQSFSIPENTTAVATILATDVDVPPQPLSFSISGGVDSGAFAITTGGVLSFAAPPNFESATDNGFDNIYNVEVTVSDGNGGTAIQAITVTVTPVNEAPVLTGANNFTTQMEDATSNVGNSVFDLISSYVADEDFGSVQGIAVVGMDSGNGTWQYSTDAGSSWTNVGTVSATSGLLLRPEDRLRLVPDGENGTTASLTFHAWDQTTGSAGGTADTAIAGGTSAFSAATAAASIVITDVNDAPVLSGGNNFTTITEDENLNNGNAVSELIAGHVTDVDNAAVEGIAIVSANSGNAAWQYSTDNGGNWIALPAVSGTSALLLRSQDRLRLLPNAENATAASVTFHAWDQTSGSEGMTADATGGGGTSAFSSATATSSITVTPLNDAPVLSGANNFVTQNENATNNSGNSVLDLISLGNITDVDNGAVQGIAVVSSDSGNGTWQYSTNAGTNWSNVGAVSATSALLLRSQDRLRLVPDGQNGTTASVTFRAWDQTVGTEGTTVDTTTVGGTSAFSTATAIASITVTDVNDAPVLAGANDFTTITEDQNTLANTGNPVSDLIAGQITDADAGALQGIAVTGLVSGNGTWQYSTGGSFTAVGAVSNSSALLLRAQDRLRFIPNGLHGTNAAVTFRAWDQTSGSAGTKVSTNTNGGTTSFSTALATSAINVLEVNDLPLAVISNTVVFTDGNFDLADYTKTVFTWGNGGTITESQQLSGGNPDEYLRVTIQVNPAPNAANFARVAAAYINNNAVYDPATQGAISGINFAQDAIFISGVGNGEAIRPALMQGGLVFIANPVQISPNTQWTTMVANNRQPTDFFLPSEDLAPITRPNFSATGQPITLGFVRFNTVTGPNTFTNVGGVDNWRAEVISTAAGNVVDEGQPLTLDGRRSTDPDSTNPPQNNNDIVLYEWDLNYDGVTFNADVSSGSSTSSVSFPDNFTARPMALRVTDSVGATSIATSLLEVRNVSADVDGQYCLAGDKRGPNSHQQRYVQRRPRRYRVAQRIDRRHRGQRQRNLELEL